MESTPFQFSYLACFCAVFETPCDLLLMRDTQICTDFADPARGFQKLLQ